MTQTQWMLYNLYYYYIHNYRQQVAYVFWPIRQPLKMLVNQKYGMEPTQHVRHHWVGIFMRAPQWQYRSSCLLDMIIISEMVYYYGSYYHAMPTINSADHPEHTTHAHRHVCITRTLRVRLVYRAQCLHISAEQSMRTTNCSSSSAIPPLTLNVTLLRWETTPNNTDTCVLHKLSVSG